jgi:hypothetical protein
MYVLALWSNVCVIWALDLIIIVASATLMDDHYRTNIISSVGHSRLDSVMPLVLCTIICNGWGTDIVL